MVFNDLTGQKFGKLTPMYRDKGATKGHTYWRCKCECGKETIVDAYKLRKGKTKSCGCWKSELEKIAHTTHGHTGSRLHRIWFNIKKRCRNKNYPEYNSYGGRGIDICDDWFDDFESFYQWSMNNGYKDDLTIDRIDNDKGYSPDNCRWTTPAEQSINKRNNIYVEYHGKKTVCTRLSKTLGIPRTKCKSMILSGMTGDEIEKEVRNGK